MEAKLKHLEMIQAVIARMASNSFMLKGWSLTVITALCGFAWEKKQPALCLLAIGVSAIFWALDGYYLHEERNFRDLYKAVTKKTPEEITFSMARECPCASCICHYLSAVFSKTLIPFYGVIILSALILFSICPK